MPVTEFQKQFKYFQEHLDWASFGIVCEERQEIRAAAIARLNGMHKIAMHREDGIIEVAAESSIRATKTHFHIIVNLNVTRNGVGFFQKHWTATEPRRRLRPQIVSPLCAKEL